MNTSLHSRTDAWEAELNRWLPLLGHRNWVVVADSAYPAQSSLGIETTVTGTDHIAVLEKTLSAIAQCKHIRARICIDAELPFVAEEDAPGVTEYRRKLKLLLRGQNTYELSHEQIISKLDEIGKLFSVLILKTTFNVPYTSIFLELECGYWDDGAEKRLREAFAKGRESAGNGSHR